MTSALSSPASARRAPFGWPTLRLDPGQEIQLPLHVPDLPAPRGGWLRVTVSVDDREEKLVSVRLPGDRGLSGEFDLKYAHSLEPFHLRLDAAAYAAARAGVVLTLTAATSPLWLLGHGLPSDAMALAPQLVPDIPADAVRAFFDRLGSLASVQTFGWMEGCVLDALHDLYTVTGDDRWRRALDDHFALFITPDNRLVYEDPRGNPADGRIYDIEGSLPFAQLAKISPEHALLDLALRFWKEKLKEDGTFAHSEACTAEGSYTIAYPLAVIADRRRDPALASLSANTLRVRRDSLRRPDGLWLRHHPDDTRTFRSWARGVAWYLLGLGRSLEHLEGLLDTSDLQAEFRDAVAWALGWQRSDGLWGCFLDDPATLPDSSGSAGIAAAIARGVRAGLLDEALLPATRRTWQGLLPWLTPDGFLDGAAQSNRGGESLQRGSYRVLSPMGMGLMGQLAAALHIEIPLPRLFVIGDSISIQYGPYLEKRAAGTFACDRKQDAAGAPRAAGNLDVPTGANGGDSGMVLAYLRHRRACDPIPPGLLLLNCGLHDIKIDPATGKPQVPLDRYRQNLNAIIGESRAMNQRLVWVRTTPVIDAIHHALCPDFLRFARDVAAYNAAADDLMDAAGVPRIDLHAFSEKFLPAGFIDHVHFTGEVREKQADFLFEALRRLPRAPGEGMAPG